jgi:hypothetical protein
MNFQRIPGRELNANVHTFTRGGLVLYGVHTCWLKLVTGRSSLENCDKLLWKQQDNKTDLTTSYRI